MSNGIKILITIKSLIEGLLDILNKLKHNIHILLEHEDLDLVLLLLWKSNFPVRVHLPIDFFIHGLSDFGSSLSRVFISNFFIALGHFFHIISIAL